MSTVDSSKPIFTLNGRKKQQLAMQAFGYTIPQEHSLELNIQVPSREAYMNAKNEEFIRMTSLKEALEEMNDHIIEATAGEFG